MMFIIIFIIVYTFLLNAPSCVVIPKIKVDCITDIDGAPKSETYPECYCKEPENAGRIECKDDA